MAEKNAFWLWFFQRISAVLILMVLAAHLYQVHYVELGRPIFFAGVVLRLKSVFSILLDSLLLFLGLFHGLNGVRTVLLDFKFIEKYERSLSRILFMVGLIFFFWGVRGLWVFIIR